MFVKRLVKAVEHLEAFSESSRVIPEIGDDIRREIIFGSFRIMYLVEDDVVWIIDVVHGASIVSSQLYWVIIVEY